jgi:hypothetical protein
VVARLGIKSKWTVHDPAGVGFVAGELGTWMTVRSTPSCPRLLTVEVRLARHVPDTVKTWAFVDELNHWSSFGRWVHDPATATLALVTGIHLDALGSAQPVWLTAAMVAALVSSAENFTYLSRPERGLDARKALTLVGGCRRGNALAITGFVDHKIVPGGKQPGTAAQIMPLVQDFLVLELLGWTVEHHRHASLAVRGSDGLSLLLLAAAHPVVGHGLMITVASQDVDLSREDALRRLAAWNRALHGQPQLGGWTLVDDHFELRSFLPNALLAWMNFSTLDLSLIFAQIQATIEQTDAALASDADPDHAGSVLLKPSWPGDQEATVLARRDPINHGPDAPDTLVWIDRLDRPAYTTVESFRRWQAQLTPEDLADRSVKGFIDWFNREHRRQQSLPRTPEHDLRLYADKSPGPGAPAAGQ